MKSRFVTFCEKCGRELERQAESTGRYNGQSGKAEEAVWIVCPLWRRRWWFGDNGHFWECLGTREQDPADDDLDDPFRTENAPKPLAGRPDRVQSPEGTP